MVPPPAKPVGVPLREELGAASFAALLAAVPFFVEVRPKPYPTLSFQYPQGCKVVDIFVFGTLGHGKVSPLLLLFW
jgi:hypothetical protein